MQSQLICEPSQRAMIEAKNGLRQFDAVRSLFSRSGGKLDLSTAVLCELNRIAIDGIFESAGTFRTGPVIITNTSHEPPEFGDVPRLTAEMCDYANSVGHRPIHCSAYLMWRLNWIHPFEDGNGRTSRAVSYLALCTGFNLDLPGTLTIPDQITRCRHPYYNALDAADAAWKKEVLDVSQMETLIHEMLTKQLETAV